MKQISLNSGWTSLPASLEEKENAEREQRAMKKKEGGAEQEFCSSARTRTSRSSLPFKAKGTRLWLAIHRKEPAPWFMHSDLI